MAVASLGPTALRKPRSLSVAPELCSRVRLTTNACRRCVETCPEEAIELRPGPRVGKACSECGLCQTACPTEVFRDELRSEAYLLDRARSLRPAAGSPARELRLHIRCQRAETPTGVALSVACLGALSESLLVGAALSGFDEILLLSGQCSRCRLQEGEPLLRASIRRARSLLDALGLCDVGLRREDRVTPPEAPRDRKELFSSIARRVRDHAAAARYRPARPASDRRPRGVEGGGRDRPSPKREILRQLLVGQGRRLEGYLDYDAEAPWGAPRVSQETCSACGICVEVCPTGAIRETRNEEEYLLSCNGARCTNCSLCVEACPEQAIGFEDRIALADVFEDRWRDVARVGLTRCVLCGESMTAAGGRLCPTCEKRDLWGAELLPPAKGRDDRRAG